MEKTPGPKKIMDEFLKGTLENLLPILTSIFNDLFKTGIFPTPKVVVHLELLSFSIATKDIVSELPSIHVVSSRQLYITKLLHDTTRQQKKFMEGLTSQMLDRVDHELPSKHRNSSIEIFVERRWRTVHRQCSRRTPAAPAREFEIPTRVKRRNYWRSDRTTNIYFRPERDVRSGPYVAYASHPAPLAPHHRTPYGLRARKAMA
ncbi:hypothetical protein EVAR_67830_1 [Eumeta japonica]|uniref:Uncharacterized protein n=1 Tax=Eumeta variegata TaxID=151549 RepID=A0A4C1ZRL4_EUMVA|nr:hypothetical protein EVAR_67830_1 [Eumeta japonica]